MNRISFRPAVDPGLPLCLLLSLFLVLPVAQNPDLPLVLLLCFALSSGGMYLFCKRRSGRLGALIAGLVYVYSPTLMHDAPYARGAFDELLALALFPLLLWRVDALRDRPTPAGFLLVYLLQAALLGARFTTALTLTGITLAWLLLETLMQLINREASQMRAGSGVLAALALLLGILGGAALWLPISPTSEPATAAFGLGFLTLEALLSAPPIQDAGAVNAARELLNLGPAQWALAGLGALAALRLYIGGYRTRHPNAFLGTACFSGLAVLLVALMLPSALELWSGSPLLQHLGAPSRLLGPTAVCLAILSSMVGLWLSRLQTRYQISTIAVVVSAPIVTAIPLLYVPEWRSSLETAAELSASARFAFGGFNGLGVSVGLLLAVAAAWRIRAWQLTPRPYWTAPALTRASAVGILLGGLIALFSLLITFREGIAWIKSPPGQALPAQVQRRYALGDQVQLLGYDLNALEFRPGERLNFTAYWYAHERPAVDYSSFLRLSSVGLPPKLLAGKLHPAGLPTSQAWGRAAYVVDKYDLRLPADLSAGEYDLVISMAVCAETPLDECAALDEAGESVVGSAVITTIRVEAP